MEKRRTKYERRHTEVPTRSTSLQELTKPISANTKAPNTPNSQAWLRSLKPGDLVSVVGGNPSESKWFITTYLEQIVSASPTKIVTNRSKYDGKGETTFQDRENLVYRIVPLDPAVAVFQMMDEVRRMARAIQVRKLTPEQAYQLYPILATIASENEGAFGEWGQPGYSAKTLMRYIK